MGTHFCIRLRDDIVSTTQHRYCSNRYSQKVASRCQIFLKNAGTKFRTSRILYSACHERRSLVMHRRILVVQPYGTGSKSSENLQNCQCVHCVYTQQVIASFSARFGWLEWRNRSPHAGPAPVDACQSCAVMHACMESWPAWTPQEALVEARTVCKQGQRRGGQSSASHGRAPATSPGGSRWARSVTGPAK